MAVSPAPRSTFYRILVSPRTFYLFRKYFRAAGEPRPTRAALQYTWRTL